ncbi:hypothetical protein QR680_011586 [Steinernema hermaphroditum]|uniref:Uncharacterized protein n=1 Tax=Steinernema hermaphroditum TaxID=289476 RepID=A0AA39LZ73_9BILA|nr:hypothetical protein QR680_011586 [Steinernema hermaphroditum]
MKGDKAFASLSVDIIADVVVQVANESRYGQPVDHFDLLRPLARLKGQWGDHVKGIRILRLSPLGISAEALCRQTSTTLPFEECSKAPFGCVSDAQLCLPCNIPLEHIIPILPHCYERLHLNIQQAGNLDSLLASFTNRFSEVRLDANSLHERDQESVRRFFVHLLRSKHLRVLKFNFPINETTEKELLALCLRDQLQLLETNSIVSLGFVRRLEQDWEEKRHFRTPREELRFQVDRKSHEALRKKADNLWGTVRRHGIVKRRQLNVRVVDVLTEERDAQGKRISEYGVEWTSRNMDI